MVQHVDLTPSLATTLGQIAGVASTARIVADTGTAVYHAEDGTDTIIGGTTGAVTPFVGDTTPPPVPSAPIVDSVSGTVFITWDGAFADGAEQPADFAYVTVLVDGSARAHLPKASTVAIGDLEPGTVATVTFTASDDAHDETGASTPNVSAATAGVQVTVTTPVTTDDVTVIETKLNDAQTAANNASKDAVKALTAANQAAEDASSAVVLRVDSSRGLVFKNSLISTDLTVSVFAKGRTITDIVDLRDAFGAGAYLEWRWRRLDDSDFGVLSSSDQRITQAGFRLSVSPADVDTKTVFMCVLNT